MSLAALQLRPGTASATAVLALALLVLHQVSAKLQCGPGIITPGVTMPQGDILLLEGQPLELYCILDLDNPTTSGRTSSSLVFYRDGKPISQEFVRVINETTVLLNITQPKVSSSMYYCKLRRLPHEKEEPAVCLNSVAVGYYPQEVDNFSCVSQNWQNLTCTWKPRPNPVKTEYRLRYYFPGRAGGRNRFGCPEDTVIKDNRCFWNETTNPHYRQPHEYYYFTIEGSNYFQNKSLNKIRFHHYAHVIPAKPENLKVLDKTPSSFLLKWTVPYPMTNFPPGLIQRVEYLPQWESGGPWHSANTSSLSPKNGTHELNVTNLQYANTLYDVRVYMRSTKASASEPGMWSAPAAITVKTPPTLPGAPPKTDIGSFEIENTVSYRNVYVHWQTIPDQMQNGDEFGYRILDIIEDGIPVSLAPIVTRKHAKFSKLDKNKDLRMSIVSFNNQGQSVNKSDIFIPGRAVAEPTSFTKVYFENGTFQLSWKPPSSKEKIVSYTIFWCDSHQDRPHACTGYLNWTHVGSNVTVKNLTVPDDKTYQFAISANTENSSSGMVWASCTILYNKPIQKMKNVWVKKVSSTFMELSWSLDCLDSNGLVQGFRIYYCPVELKGLEKVPICKSPYRNMTVYHSNGNANLTNLLPYTTYSVSVAVLTQGGETLPSEPLLNVTLEAAPSAAPQGVSIANVTNTTVVFKWTPPVQRNGVITKYEIYYNDKIVTKNMDPSENITKEQELTLENLRSYSNYSISIAACTVACSERSPPLSVETRVGVPSVVINPRANMVNGTHLTVDWDPPSMPAGPLDYYEVQITRPERENETAIIRRTEGTVIQEKVSCVEGEDFIFRSVVRAVNVDPISGEEFVGNWTKPTDSNCYQQGLSDTAAIFIYIVVAGITCIVLIIVGYISKRAWAKWRDMRDVEVKLPPGLVIPSDHERDNDFNMHQWVNPNHDPNSLGIRSAADEECLLQRKGDHHERNLSGESSGCSSGHDSVSSSTTSGTHISGTDSGTEVDQLDHRGFAGGEAVWESGSDSGSLRQRNGNVRPNWEGAYSCIGGKGARSTPNLTELEPSVATGYTTLGTHWPSNVSIPDKQPDPSTLTVQPGGGYVPLEAAAALPSPVVQGGKPAVKPDASHGYVAHPTGSELWAQRVPPKGYVTTGEKRVSSEEDETDWEEMYSAGELQRLKSPAGGYVKAGESALRPSRTEPALGSGYVMTGENILRRDRDRHKADLIPQTIPQQVCYSVTVPPPDRLKQALGGEDSPSATARVHEYVMTGEREPVQSPPLLVLSSDPSQPYCRFVEKDANFARPVPASSGYVPHRQLQAHNASSVVE